MRGAPWRRSGDSSNTGTSRRPVHASSIAFFTGDLVPPIDMKGKNDTFTC
jgi:hypothetical protein